MKIGYPCINRSIGCSSNKKFRLANFTEEKFNETVKNNKTATQVYNKYVGGKQIYPSNLKVMLNGKWKNEWRKRMRGGKEESVLE